MSDSIISTPLFDDKDYIGINGVGINQMEHPHFQEWFKFIVSDYKPPKGKIGLFIPCSAIKPYFNSPIHKVINRSITKYEDYIHKIVISNAGIIPYEFSGYYPFNSYDWNPWHETEEIKKRYITLTVERLISFFNKHSTEYIGFISYFRPDAEELIALKIASETTKIDIIHIDVNIKDCDNKLSDTSDLDLVLTIGHNLDRLKHTIEKTIEETTKETAEEITEKTVKNDTLPYIRSNIQHIIPDRGNNMPKRIHIQTEIKLDIDSSDLTKDALILISDMLQKEWPNTYLSDLDVNDYIEIVTDLWTRHYINSDKTKEAINKIKSANPPSSIKTYLVFNLFDDEDNLIIDYSEMSTEPFFRSYLSTGDLWDTYAYVNSKFKSLEIIEPAYIEEIKQGMSMQQKMSLDDTILQAYGFHNRLLGATPRRIRLYTSQPPDKIDRWNRKGMIPKGSYFTDSMARTEYYWQEGDIIVDYRLPEDKIVATSEFGDAKEYVTIEDIPIK